MRACLCLFMLMLALSATAACTPESPEAFADFLPHYLREARFALQRTQFPLRLRRWEYGQDAQGRDRSVARVSTQSAAQFADELPLAKLMRDNGLTYRRHRQRPTNAIIEVFKPETDWVMHYHFRQRLGCWQLWQIEDFST